MQSPFGSEKWQGKEYPALNGNGSHLKVAEDDSGGRGFWEKDHLYNIAWHSLVALARRSPDQHLGELGGDVEHPICRDAEDGSE